MKRFIKKICPNCGKEFETKDKGSKTATYCSNSCYREHKGIGKKKYGICKVCGKEFELVHGKGTTVCSKECLGKYRSMILSKEHTYKSVCKNCGKEFETNNWVKDVQFCCRDCYWEYRNSHDEEYSYIGDKRKDNAREKRICKVCGKEFETYKKSGKMLCSTECQHEYRRSVECKEKRKVTFDENFKKGLYDEEIKNRSVSNSLRNKEKREEKYKLLCENSNLTIIEYVSTHVIKVRCKKCGKEFETNNLSYLPYERIPCKQCGEEYTDFKPALKIYDLLDTNGIEYIKNDRVLISPYEIDIYIPKFKLGIEINGNYWHSELCGKDKNYHLSKTKKSFDNGIKLIHIYEDEITNKWDIVESRILNLVKKTKEKIYARKCIIKVIDKKTKKEFLNKTHIQGDSSSSVNLGLFFEDRLVSVMTFGSERVIYKADSSEGKYELMRFSNALNTSVIGGFSKLLNYFIKEYSPRHIKTFCDVRWSGIDYKNTVYLKNGFVFEDISKPNYWYMYKTNMLKRLHRYNFTKHSILSKHSDLDENKTEWELMKELGYNRIWDCGNLRFSIVI